MACGAQYDEKELHVFQNSNNAFRKGMTKEEVADYYTNWANDNGYDKELPSDIYSGPAMLAKLAADQLTPEERALVKVLDVAAGTGLCAVHLKAHGFQHIDALDPSQGMLDKAKEKNLYERYICDFISDKPLDIAENEYDMLTVCGGHGEGHIPSTAFHEMVRLVKPGGRIVIVMRDAHRYNCEDYINHLDKLVDQLEKDGKWKKIFSEIFPNFLTGMNGFSLVFRIC